jgi:hypothetical protein
MKNRLLVLITGLSCAVLAGSVMAHGPSYSSRHGGGLSGAITIWSGDPYGAGYAGSLHYGSGYFAPAHSYYPRVHFYPAYGHQHHSGYRHGSRHSYRHGYDHGYYKGHSRHYNRHDRHRRHYRYDD